MERSTTSLLACLFRALPALLLLYACGSLYYLARGSSAAALMASPPPPPPLPPPLPASAAAAAAEVVAAARARALAAAEGAQPPPPPPLDLPAHALAPARAIWDYMRMGHERYFAPLPPPARAGSASPSPAAPGAPGAWRADAIIALGSNDLRVAVRAAELYLAGYGARLVLSGGVGALTRGLYGDDSEAEAMAKVAEAMGVPRSAMLLEGASTNTGENMRLSFMLLREDSLHWQRYPLLRHAILVQKPFMERRTWATFLRQWPAVPVPRAFVTSPQASFEEYAAGAPRGARGLAARDILTTMMGDLQRIAVYPALGFQEFQEIPQPVWDALRALIAAGFSSEQLLLAPGAARGSARPEDYEGLASPHPPQRPADFVGTEIQ